MATIIRKLISTTSAPQPVAPYTWETKRKVRIYCLFQKCRFPYAFFRQAVVVDRTVYVSGCLGLDENTGKLVEGVAAQTELALQNLKNVLIASGSDLEKVVKTAIFVQNLDDFASVNDAYKKGEIQCKKISLCG